MNAPYFSNVFGSELENNVFVWTQHPTQCERLFFFFFSKTFATVGLFVGCEILLNQSSHRYEFRCADLEKSKSDDSVKCKNDNPASTRHIFRYAASLVGNKKYKNGTNISLKAMDFLFVRRSRSHLFQKQTWSAWKTCYSKEEPQIINRLVYAWGKT